MLRERRERMQTSSIRTRSRAPKSKTPLVLLHTTLLALPANISIRYSTSSGFSTQYSVPIASPGAHLARQNSEARRHAVWTLRSSPPLVDGVAISSGQDYRVHNSTSSVSRTRTVRFGDAPETADSLQTNESGPKRLACLKTLPQLRHLSRSFDSETSSYQDDYAAPDSLVLAIVSLARRSTRSHSARAAQRTSFLNSPPTGLPSPSSSAFTFSSFPRAGVSLPKASPSAIRLRKHVFLWSFSAPSE
jgi:hypothetical protein